MIKENLRFLGYTPFTTTHASDNFGKLYEYAVKLIEKGKAYCCFLSKEESSKLRTDMKPSPYRETPIADNLEIFRKMKLGYYKEN
jgi:glutaminyl-tRNA synthetase